MKAVALWRLPPLPELTEIMLEGIGEGGVCGLALPETGFYPALR